MLLVHASGSAQRVAPEPAVEPCPAAAEWIRSHPPSPDAQHSQHGSNVVGSHFELLEQLKARVDSDQDARRKWLADPINEELARAVDTIDSANLAWLRKLIAKKGFPTAEQVGREGIHLAWILLQHADQDSKLQSPLC